MMSSDTDEDQVLRRLIFGLRWEYAERSDATGPEVFDLDASCVALDPPPGCGGNGAQAFL